MGGRDVVGPISTDRLRLGTRAATPQSGHRCLSNGELAFYGCGPSTPMSLPNPLVPGADTRGCGETCFKSSKNVPGLDEHRSLGVLVPVHDPVMLARTVLTVIALRELARYGKSRSTANSLDTSGYSPE